MSAFGFEPPAFTGLSLSAATIVCRLVREHRGHDDLVRWLSSDVASEPGCTWPVGYVNTDCDEAIDLDSEGGDDGSLCV